MRRTQPCEITYGSLVTSAAWARVRCGALPSLLLALAMVAPAQVPGQQTPIQHIIVVFQENRSTDNLFHDPKLIAEGADIASTGQNSKGKTIRLAAITLASNYDLGHSHTSFLKMYDNGRMDGADEESVSCVPHALHCPPRNPQFKYVQASDVAPYFQMAEQFTFADHMFQTNQGASFPAHQFILAGTSAPTATSDFFASGNPFGVPNAVADTGCTAPPKELVQLIDPSGDENYVQYPCFEHPTLTDLLDNQGISWRYYTPSGGSMWTAPNAISHIRLGPDWGNVVMQPTQVLTDIKNGQLAGVSWVIPTWAESDHSTSQRKLGPSWVASIVNAVGNSPYWANTAVLISWDDWGGWYDHVPPQVINSYEYGFRVPLIVVSSYAKQGHISHATHDFGSILKFTEKVFGLPSLGYADKNADDLFECFDFNQAHKFHKINAPHDVNYFLKHPTPLEDPDDD